MKILFISPGLYKRGGIIVVTSLARELIKMEHDVHLACFKINQAETIDQYFVEHTLPITFLKTKEKKDQDKIRLDRIPVMADYIKQQYHNFDHIIIDSWYNVASMIQSNRPYHKFTQLVQSLPEFNPLNDQEVWKSEIFKLLPRYPHKKIAVSKEIKKYFSSHYEQKIQSINLFIDPHYLSYQYNPSNNKTLELISSAANFDHPDKGLTFLLDALQQSPLSFKLTLVSNAQIDIDLQKYTYPIAQKSAKNPIEMIQLFQGKDIYINTSRNETFCLALAEAMSVGMPCIVTDSIGNRDYINKKNSILMHTQQDLDPALQQMQDTDIRQKYSQEAHSSMQKYTIQNTANEFINSLTTH